MHRTYMHTHGRARAHTHASEHCCAQGNTLEHTHVQVGEYDVMAPLVAKEKQSVMQSLDAQVPPCCKRAFLTVCHVLLALLLGVILQVRTVPAGLAYLMSCLAWPAGSMGWNHTAGRGRSKRTILSCWRVLRRPKTTMCPSGCPTWTSRSDGSFLPLPRVCRYLSCNIGNCRTRWPRWCGLVLLGLQKAQASTAHQGGMLLRYRVLDDPYLHPGRLLNDIMIHVEPVCSNSQHAGRTAPHCLSYPLAYFARSKKSPRTRARVATLRGAGWHKSADIL